LLFTSHYFFKYFLRRLLVADQMSIELTTLQLRVRCFGRHNCLHHVVITARSELRKVLFLVPSVCGFWATVCKTVCPVLSDQLSVCLSVCPLCNVRALCPNGWTDQDETWQAGRPRPWPQCVRWGPSSPPPKGLSPQFSAHICCGQIAAWIKMPLGMKLGLSPGDFVLDGDQADP